MRKILIPIIVFATLAGFQEPPTTVAKQSPESILSRAIQSIGGRRALEQMQSFHLHGVMRLADKRPVVEIDLSTSLGGKVLGIMTYIGLGQSRFGSNGKISWEQKFNAKQEPIWTLIDQATLSQKVQQINWLEWFTMLPAKINSMEFVGTEQFDDEVCWKLSIKDDKNHEQQAFFSQTTFRPRGRRTVEKTSNGNATVNIYFRDWQRVGDLLLFHTIVYDRDGSQVKLSLDRISMDPIPDTLFSLPEQIKVMAEQP